MLSSDSEKIENAIVDDSVPKTLDLRSQLLMLAEAATMLKVTSEQVRSLIRQGRLSAANVGTGAKRPLYRISRQALDDFLNDSQPHFSKAKKKKFKQLSPVPDFFPHLK